MIKRPRGTRDILPPDSRLWAAVEAEALRAFSGWGYDLIRLPVFESTELFSRSVGEGTDIVSKEMYTFEDRSKRSLTLRPEGTASVARAFVEAGMGSTPMPRRLAYIGPMFRYERQQKDRYRQFWQIGAELIGADSAIADAEMLLLLHGFLTRLGFDDLVFKVNNLGDAGDREAWANALRDFARPRLGDFCGDCNRRFELNALRMLDCKNRRCQELLVAAPLFGDIRSSDSAQHVFRVIRLLMNSGLDVTTDPRLVRGLDYYCRTVFEVMSPELGEDTVLCGGGRYDGLIADLGGPQLGGVGFAIGFDRLITVLPDSFRDKVLGSRRVAILPLVDNAATSALDIAQDLVREGHEVAIETSGRSLKSGLKWAAKLPARWVVLLGENELAAGELTLRNLDSRQQRTLPFGDLHAALVENEEKT